MSSWSRFYITRAITCDGLFRQNEWPSDCYWSSASLTSTAWSTAEHSSTSGGSAGKTRTPPRPESSALLSSSLSDTLSSSSSSFLTSSWIRIYIQVCFSRPSFAATILFTFLPIDRSFRVHQGPLSLLVVFRYFNPFRHRSRPSFGSIMVLVIFLPIARSFCVLQGPLALLVFCYFNPRLRRSRPSFGVTILVIFLLLDRLSVFSKAV